MFYKFLFRKFLFFLFWYCTKAYKIIKNTSTTWAVPSVKMKARNTYGQKNGDR